MCVYQVYTMLHSSMKQNSLRTRKNCENCEPEKGILFFDAKCFFHNLLFILNLIRILFHFFLLFVFQ